MHAAATNRACETVRAGLGDWAMRIHSSDLAAIGCAYELDS